MYKSRKYDEIIIGEKASITRSFSKDDVDLFIKISDDNNPIHSSDEYAATTRFRQKVVPGMLTASMISGVLGTKLPGYGTIYLAQELQFVRPVYFGDILTCEVVVIEKIESKKIIILDTQIINQENKVVIDGRATVVLGNLDYITGLYINSICNTYKLVFLCNLDVIVSSDTSLFAISAIKGLTLIRFGRYIDLL